MSTIGNICRNAIGRMRPSTGPEVFRPDAPFDSFTEQRLWNYMEWALHPNCEIQRQIRATDPDGNAIGDTFHVRVDFRLIMGSRRVVIEVDGDAWHDHERDQSRDIRLLHMGFADTIYRLPADSVWNLPGACACALALAERDLFAFGPRRYLMDHYTQAKAIRITKRAIMPDGSIKS